MFAIIGALLLLFIFVFAFLLVCGLPLGEFTMGGQEKVLPKKLRFGVVGFMILHALFICMILQGGGFMAMWFSKGITMKILIGIGVMLVINTLMNAISRSKKEKYLMTPLSLCTAICFFVTAFTMK